MRTAAVGPGARLRPSQPELLWAFLLLSLGHFDPADQIGQRGLPVGLRDTGTYDRFVGSSKLADVVVGKSRCDQEDAEFLAAKGINQFCPYLHSCPVSRALLLKMHVKNRTVKPKIISLQKSGHVGQHSVN